MRPLNSALAIVLSYALVITPIFGQSEESSSEDREESSETTTTPDVQPEPSSETTPVTVPETTSDSAPAEPTEQQTKKKKRVVEDEAGAPPKGTGKLVAGIVTSSVGAGLGLLFLAYANIDCNSINKDDANSSDTNKQKERETDVKDCKDQQKPAKTAAAVFITAGLGVGLPLLYFGIQDRKVYNQWKEGQPAQDDNAFVPGKASLVFLSNAQDSFSPGINVSYQF